jgi:hypothetical protein
MVCAACTRANFVPVGDGAADADMTDGGTDIEVTSRATEVNDTEVPDAGVDTRACPAPSVPSCVPSTTGICDPVCQTGACDWCAQKCSYVVGSAGGVPACAGTGAGLVFQPCAVRSSGTPQQSDDCAPGGICLAPVIGDSPAYCFSLCRTSADCLGGVACGQRRLSAASGLVAVCDPAYDQCGPDGTCCDPVANLGCPANRVCLLVTPDLGSGHSRTVCEFAYGDGRDGSPCSSARDCQIRNTCVDGSCRVLCSATTTCPAGGACTPQGSEYGYCS